MVQVWWEWGGGEWHITGPQRTFQSVCVTLGMSSLWLQFLIYNMGGFESVVAVELLGLFGPWGILGGSEPHPSILSLSLALHNETEAGKGSYGFGGASLRCLNHGEPFVCPNLSTLFFLASLEKQLCGSRKASLLLCTGCSSLGADEIKLSKWSEFPSSHGKKGRNHKILSFHFLRNQNRPTHLQRK